MNPVSYLVLFVSITLFLLSLYLYKEYSKSDFHKRYIALFAVTGFFILYLYLLMNSSSIREARFWIRFLAVSHFIFPLINDSLFYLYSNRERPSKRIRFILIYLPFSILFILDTFFPSLTFEDPVLTRYGWMYVNKLGSPVFYAYNILYFLNILFLIVFISYIYKNEPDRGRKRFLMFFALLLLFPFVLFLLMTYLLPEGADYVAPFIGIVGFISSLVVVLSLYKYNFFDISLEIAIEDIANQMTNLLFLLDKDKKIVRINQYASRLLSYEPGELTGKPFKEIIFSEHREKIHTGLPASDSEIYFRSRNNAFIPAVLTITEVFRRNTFIGYTVLATDMLKIRQLSSEKKMLQLELKALQSQMNPHFIFNSLNSILLLISRRDEVKANEYITCLSNLIRRVMENVNKEYISVNEEVELLEAYLTIESLRFDNSFSYSLNVKGDIDLTAPVIPPMIIQPFVENAIWHGLLPMGPGTDKRLTIDFERDPDLLTVVITDNGVGRKATENNWWGKQKEHRSQGIRNIEERIGLFNSSSENMNIGLNIKDLKYKNNVPSGTEVSVVFHFLKPAEV